MKKNFQLWGWVLVMTLLSGCAAKMVELAAPLSPIDDTGAYYLESAVTVKTARAAKLVLRQDSEWIRVGKIAQGDVYDTRDQVVTVNSFDVHEASIVVNAGQLVGFYLEVPKTFVAATPVAIRMDNRE